MELVRMSFTSYAVEDIIRTSNLTSVPAMLSTSGNVVATYLGGFDMDIVTRGKRGGIIYLACIKCGSPKTTRKSQRSALCRACGSGRIAAAIVGGKKFCTQCRETKPIADFAPDKRKKSGLSSACKECRATQSREWRRNHPEQNRKWALVQWHKKPRVSRHALHIKRMFGMSADDYKNLLDFQGGVCAICGQKETRHSSNGKDFLPLAVDHDHKTGRVRGLLCSRCNTAIGYFDDDVVVIEKALVYLKEHLGRCKHS
jgi:hypothetical protein